MRGGGVSTEVKGEDRPPVAAPHGGWGCVLHWSLRGETSKEPMELLSDLRIPFGAA